MKKCAFVTVVMALSIAILSSWCLAQPVTNISKEGSLLIWPKIITDGDTDITTDTFIMINNSYPAAVNVKCYWEYKDTTVPYNRGGCVNYDFQFKLTANQPAVFSAATGLHMWEESVQKSAPIAAFGYPGEGILKCWAVDASAEHQISWNYLKAEAIVMDYTANSAWEYNAWRFAANQARGVAVGTGGRIELNGSQLVATPGYDACPSYLVFDFLADTVGQTTFDNLISSDLTLIPCKQNLKQEGTPTKTKATFTIWNENEIKFTGAHQCFSCFMEVAFDDLRIPQDTGKIKPFNISRLHTYAARMRVQGLQSNNYCPLSVATPLLGVIDTTFTTLEGVGYTDKVGTNPSTTSAKWSGDPVYIQWDPGYASEEKPKQ